MLVGLKGTESNAACLSSPDGELHLRVEPGPKAQRLLVVVEGIAPLGRSEASQRNLAVLVPEIPHQFQHHRSTGESGLELYGVRPDGDGPAKIENRGEAA